MAMFQKFGVGEVIFLIVIVLVAVLSVPLVRAIIRWLDRH
jgi:hypothetical protein